MKKIKLTPEQFRERSFQTHNDRYDYSKVEYQGNNIKVVIICKEHGEFEQLPSHHWRGSGCPKCAGVNKGNKKDFISKAKDVHGDLYNYSKIQYKGNKQLVSIICEKHGDFQQTPNNHLRGQKCPACNLESKCLTQEEFLQKSIMIHGNQYIYDDVVYEHNLKSIKIKCKKHGTFNQLPFHHIYYKCGCPICKMSKGELQVRKYLNDNNYKYKAQFKFEDCKLKRCLPFDFVVFRDNGLILIEYQGKHHYEPVGFGSSKGKEIHENTVLRDDIKRNYCKLNGYYLIEIPYTCKDIASFLDKALK